MFDTPHKALRFAFSEMLTQAGKTDFKQIKEVRALKDKMQQVFSLVKSHSHHEDDICFADLDKIAPNATQHDRLEHIRLHRKLDDLMVMAIIIIDGIKAERPGHITGRALYTDLCQLHAEMLTHMMEEERDTQPVFWGGYMGGVYGPEIGGILLKEDGAYDNGN